MRRRVVVVTISRTGVDQVSVQVEVVFACIVVIAVDVELAAPQRWHMHTLARGQVAARVGAIQAVITRRVVRRAALDAHVVVAFVARAVRVRVAAVGLGEVLAITTLVLDASHRQSESGV